jgi:glucose-6-phosphate isomerase
MQRTTSNRFVEDRGSRVGSGSKIETSSQRALFQQQFEAAGLNPVEHMLLLLIQALPSILKFALLVTVINADPNVADDLAF